MGEKEKKPEVPFHTKCDGALQSSVSSILRIGLDIGSTTVKLAAIPQDGEQEIAPKPVFLRGRRHYSASGATAANLLRELAAELDGKYEGAISVSLSGSGGIGIAKEFGLPFMQEVAAAGEAVRRLIPDADVVVELGGEDAKIMFLTGGAEQRMNETCAGGTGAFIDRMAAFLDTDAEGLNALAEKGTAVYPVASRCGVFAKADILPLLNEGCSKEDIALSIFRAVVDQTVSGLACGRKIEGKVVFLGGPLTYLSRLRRCFAETLRLPKDKDILPENSLFFVAIGAAVLAPDKPLHIGLSEKESVESKAIPCCKALLMLAEMLERPREGDGIGSLRPLFQSREELAAFRERHSKASAARGNIDELASGVSEFPVWLGMDAGSTTIKSVLIDAEGRILHETYASNHGNTLAHAREILENLHGLLPPNAYVAGACVTGYGAALLKAAFRFDEDEVETVAHARASCFFEPEATFVLDIGGQDMKCLRLRRGIIVDLQLNEACSSGCGSFIETFATSLGMELGDFIEKALFARFPADLGTRCTVFMNSKVKQAQKEGRPSEDIAAGLSYSVIRNALYKVIRIGDTDELGEHIVVQGGGFRNEALLRAFELLIGKDVVRPDIAGVMGAFGSALLARDASLKASGKPARSSLMGKEEIQAFRSSGEVRRCAGCSNRCLLTVSRFGNEGVFVAGNRCERGEALALGDGTGRRSQKNAVPDLVAEKYARLFEPYHALAPENAPRGELGIPRALNMYENYPFWFTLFTTLGFRIVLSPPSGKALFTMGMDTIPSQTVCYPAKLCHGHIVSLVKKGVKRIFFPCVMYEKSEFYEQDNKYNCPVVTGYPELLRNNIDILRSEGVELIAPVIIADDAVTRNELAKLPAFKDISADEWDKALAAAHKEQDTFRAWLKNRAVDILASLAKNGGQAIVLAGHPYHIDPEIGRGISSLIAAEGIAVLTEDSVSGLAGPPASLRVVNQWTYHARLYRAAATVLLSGSRADKDSPLAIRMEGENARWPSMAMLQILSFGCGLDAVTTDQVRELLASEGHLYTYIKIDEGANTSAARIRIRSLAATLRLSNGACDNAPREESHLPCLPCSGKHAPTGAEAGCPQDDTPPFTEDMKKTHTILIPQMSPFQFQFLPAVLRACGYKAELLPNVEKEAWEIGLRYVNNDVCYPAVTVIGQLLEAARRAQGIGRKVALILSQTGGACRATNYISFLKKALKDSGMKDIPILSFNLAGLARNPGFNINSSMVIRALMSLLCGDLLMRLVLRTRPYEAESGAAEKRLRHWSGILEKDIYIGKWLPIWKHAAAAIRDFDKLPFKPDCEKKGRRPLVGIVGEILLKYHPNANNNAIGVIEAEGGEAVLSGVTDFILYALFDDVYRIWHFGGKAKKWLTGHALMSFVQCMRLPIAAALSCSKRFSAPVSFKKLRSLVRGIVSEGQQAGEGWLLTAEMAELLESGVPNILCLQPFGCLPNHITGKGVIKELRRRYPNANIAAVDYDAGVSEVNQINRIRLMMAVAVREGKKKR